MKTKLMSSQVALAVAALCASGTISAVVPAFADSSTVDIAAGVTTNKNLLVNQQLIIQDLVQTQAGASSEAVLNDVQDNQANVTTNSSATENNAVVGARALQFINGNTGVNVAAGTNNQQANAAALAMLDQQFAFASADATSVAWQNNAGNTTYNLGTQNNASGGDGILQYALGNVGVNVTAGTNNQQKNDLAMAVGSPGLTVIAVASESVKQSNVGNATTNDLAYVNSFHNDGSVASIDLYLATNNASLGNDALFAASGNIGVNVSAGTNNQQYNGLAVAVGH